MSNSLYERILTADQPGGWIDRLDSRGQPAMDFMPASTLYHVICALDELDRFATRQPGYS